MVADSIQKIAVRKPQFLLHHSCRHLAVCKIPLPFIIRRYAQRINKIIEITFFKHIMIKRSGFRFLCVRAIAPGQPDRCFPDSFDMSSSFFRQMFFEIMIDKVRVHGYTFLPLPEPGH